MSTPALAFLVVWVALTAAHHTGDYILQTDHQSAHKGLDNRHTFRLSALLGHVAGYTVAQAVAVTLAVTVLDLDVAPAGIALALAWSGITHGIIDTRIPVRVLMTATGSREFYAKGGSAFVDQSLHHAMIFFGALLATTI